MATKAIDAAREALSEHYDAHDGNDDSLIIRVSDAGDDDPEAAEALEHIQALVAPHGCSADWTGSGNTSSDGESTSDVRVTAG